MSFLVQPWPWYIAGFLIGLYVPALFLIGNKRFGISSSLRHICAACVPAKISFFQYDWKKEIWHIYFVTGIAVGAYIAAKFLTIDPAVAISEATVSDLSAMGIKDFSDLLPRDIFSWEGLITVRGFIFIVIGGFLVGFGTRYAGGCTSGYSITGLSALQWSALVATICFMAGGIFVTHFILPFLLKL